MEKIRSNLNKPERVLIDTDMGNDDIMAISMLLTSPNFQVVGYSLTDGVARTPAGARNLSGLLNYLKKPSPIAIGPERSFQTSIDFPPIDIKRAEELTLLNGLKVTPSEPKLQPFSEMVESTLKDPVTVFALGPMTNVAAMIENYPQFKDKVARIVMMGGGIEAGNVSPDNLAEYNIALDPPSADIVFKSGIPIVMVGIDATRTVPATPEFAREISTLIPGTKEGTIIRKIIINNTGDVNQFYDPLTAAILMDPSIITETKTGTVSVAQQGSNIGQTLLKPSISGNTQVVSFADAPKFFDLTRNLITNNKKGGV